MTTEGRIRKFVVDELLRKGVPEDITEETSLIDSDVLDSVGIVKLISFLEDDFRIKIRDDEILPRNFETIRAVGAFVELKRAS